MVDTLAIEKKWTEKWVKDKVFEVNHKKGRKKFFLTFPYPYVNSYLHIGHLYTLMRVEAFARYKRMKGFNVLFPQAWHCTGSPIYNAAKRVAEKEEKQLKLLKDIGIKDSEIKKFAEPKHWVDFFVPEARKDYKAMGMSIDWRRSFITTDLNPHYDKFIRWQFNKLKEKGYVVKGKFPVVWDPVENTPVGDHDRKEGEGVTHKDFIWAKYRMTDSDLIIMTGTTRPDALYGQSNLWVDPEGDYVIVKVLDEKWVVGKDVVGKIKNQYDNNVKIIGKITPEELIGKWAQGPLMDKELYILPAWFIDSSVGSGIVYSALEDPVDLYELDKIQNDKETQEKYGLDKKVVDKLAPISIIKVPGMGDDLGRDIGEEFGVKSAKDIDKLEKAKGELNKRVFRKGIMKKKCGECAGMTVPDAQELLKIKLIKENDAVMFYELDGKVISRALNECIVKIVDDQWFMAYGNKNWKKLAHKNLDKIKLYPDKVRPQFDYVIDWLHNWACTREAGLGTRLPWDEKWLIESLSDSTIYMAYYTITHILQDLNIKEVNDELFDYVLLGKGKPKNNTWKQMRDEFDYWYPLDFRNSGKDLVQNHLTFFMFNHAAIFPEKKWPQSIGVNGWVTVDGQKMSKSLGNMIPLRDMPHKFSVDSARFTIMSGGEGLDDPNWDSNFAKAFKAKLDFLHEFSLEHYGKGRDSREAIDDWMESKLNEIIKTVEEFMEETLFRSASQNAFFALHNDVNWYMRRCKNNPNKELMQKIIETRLLLITPFCPCMCEEIWSKIGKKDYISLASWPKIDNKKINYELDLKEKVIENTMEDITSVLKLVKIKPEKITLFVSLPWKYELFKLLAKKVKQTRNPKEVLGFIMQNSKMKKYGKEISKFVPKLVTSNRVPEKVASANEEVLWIKDAKVFLEEEFKVNIEIIKAEDSKEAKAGQASPMRPAILVS
jgi:leucyl-tRNA synthetase